MDVCHLSVSSANPTRSARLLARFCEASGLSVIRAQVGDEFVCSGRAEHPDLIILDVELPGELAVGKRCRAEK